MNIKIQIQKPAAWELLKESIQFIGHHFKLCFKFIFWQVVLITALIQVMLFALASNLPSFVILLIFLGVNIFNILYQIYFAIGVKKLLENPKEQKLLVLTKKYIKPVFMNTVAVSLLIIVLLSILPIISVLTSEVLLSANLDWLQALILLVSSIVDFILFIYLLPAFFFSMDGKASVKQVFNKSIEFVKGWWWPLFSYVIFMALIFTFIKSIELVPSVGSILSMALVFFVNPVIIIYLQKAINAISKNSKRQKKAKWNILHKGLTVFFALVIAMVMSAVLIMSAPSDTLSSLV